MSEVVDQRIAVVAAVGTVGVTVTLGDVQVTVRTPSPPGSASMSAEALRAAAIRAARRALEVALEELISESS